MKFNFDIFQILNKTVNWTSGEGTMFQSLNHPDKSTRIAAIKLFLEKVESKQVCFLKVY